MPNSSNLTICLETLKSPEVSLLLILIPLGSSSGPQTMIQDALNRLGGSRGCNIIMLMIVIVMVIVLSTFSKAPAIFKVPPPLAQV